MKWSMCVCDTNTASMGRSVAAGVRSMRPRSTSSARPCQRSDTRSAGSPVCPFNSRGRKVVFMEPGDSMEPRRGWPASPGPAIRRAHAAGAAGGRRGLRRRRRGGRAAPPGRVPGGARGRGPRAHARGLLRALSRLRRPRRGGRGPARGGPAGAAGARARAHGGQGGPLPPPGARRRADLSGRAGLRARGGSARPARHRLGRAAARDRADPRAGRPRRSLHRDRERRGRERRKAVARGLPPRARAAARAAPGPRTPRLPGGRGLAARRRERAPRRHALPRGHQLVSRRGARRGRPGRELAGGGRMGPARVAVLALQLLQDQARRLGHHLLHDLPHRLLGGLELGDERREDGEVALLAVGAHAPEPRVHRLHEAAVGGDDLAVEVLLQQALVHARSIESRFLRFNVIAALSALLVAGAARAVEVPGMGGRVVAGGYLDGLAVAETEGGPRQRPGALLDLHLDGRATPWLGAHLDLRTRIGGPFEGGHPGVYNLDHEFQNRSPSLEASEAYADVNLRRADLRLGIQKLAWGKLDGVPPTDVVNPRDYHDPLVEDFEERKIGIPALAGTYYLPDLPRLGLAELRATLVYVPLAVPPRLALREERWFPASTVPPTAVVVPRALASRALGVPLPGDLVIPVRCGTLDHRPPRRLDAGGIAARLAGTWHESDWDLYHYTGPETGPDADLRPEVRLVSAAPLRLRAVSFLRQAHDVIHMTGADVSSALGGFTVRTEAAYFDNRPYLRPSSDLIRQATAPATVERVARQVLRRGRVRVPLGDLFPTLDAVEWGIGADYLIHGFTPLVQLNQIAILDRAPRLLIHDPETRLSGTLRKKLLAERLELEVKGTYAIERQAWFVFPRASYLVRDDLRLRLGYLALGGPRASILGQFRDNDEVVLQARYSF